MVISDTKDCNRGTGNDVGEESDSGCSYKDETAGGCADETSHNGGCSHVSSDEGGCTDEGDDDGGCFGSDSGSMGNSQMCNPLSRKNCRLGQLIFVKIHDQVHPEE